MECSYFEHDNTTINNNGQKGAIAGLFGWPYEDIVEESDFLKLEGYLGVKILYWTKFMGIF